MVSVIMPTFNRKQTIKRAIESVLQQTYQDLELIIVDDGSTDGTDEFVAEIRDDRIKYIYYLKNQGVSHARNVGLQNVQGEYLAFIDSDNCWDKNHLARRMSILSMSEKPCFSFGNMRVYLDHHEQWIFPNLDLGQVVDGRKLFHLMLTSNRIDTNTVVMTRECVDDAMTFDETMSALEDWDFFFRIIRKPEINIFFDREITVDHFDSVDSLSRKKNTFLRNRLKIYEKNEDLLSNDYNDDMMDADLDYFGELSDFEWETMFCELSESEKDVGLRFLAHIFSKQNRLFQHMVKNYHMNKHIVEIDEILNRMKVGTVAIYGFGNYGKRLYQQLQNTHVPVKYVIDQSMSSHYEGETFFTDQIPDALAVDLLIVAMFSGATDIVRTIKEKTDVQVYSLEEL